MPDDEGDAAAAEPVATEAADAAKAGEGPPADPLWEEAQRTAAQQDQLRQAEADQQVRLDVTPKHMASYIAMGLFVYNALLHMLCMVGAASK